MREDNLAGLAVIGTTSGQISPDRRANHRRSLKVPRRAPASDDQFVANLHHGRPDVVEELHLSHRLQTANRHADRAACNGSFREWRIENAVGSEAALQAGGGLENSPFALDLR